MLALGLIVCGSPDGASALPLGSPTQASAMCVASITDTRATRSEGGIITVGISFFAGRRRGSDDAHFASALTAELQRQLLSARRVGAGGTSRTMQSSPLLVVKIAESGSVSDVDLWLTGSVFHEDSLVRTSVRVIRTRDGAMLWTGTRSRPVLQLPMLARFIAQEFVSRIGARLSAPPPASPSERSPETYELMLRGTYVGAGYAPSDLARAIGFFDEAVARDPKSSGARRLRENAQLRLLAWGGDGSSLESQLVERGLLRRVNERDRDESERLVEEADEETRGGQPGHACELLNAAIDNDARSTPAYALRSLLRARSGAVREAFADAETVTQLGRPMWGDALRAVVLRRAGDTTTARRLVARLLVLTRQRQGALAFWDARFVAHALSEMGESAAAQSVIQRVDPRDPRVSWLQSDPALRPRTPTPRGR
jgi:TolB-like protein